MKLPTRPPNHNLATQAERKFASLLPPEWTVEWVRNDYGLDCLVFPFENHHPTGDVLGVQLKGTSRAEDTHVVISTSTMNYFALVKHPVWLVVYDAVSDSCHQLDLGEELRDLTRRHGPSWRDADTHAIKLDRMAPFDANALRGVALPQSHLAGELEAIEEDRSRSILATVLDELAAGNGSNLTKRVNARLSKDKIRAKKEEVEQLLLASAIARVEEGQLALAGPSSASMTAMLDLQAARAMDWMVQLGWQGSADPETLGKVVALAVGNGRAPAGLLDQLWKHFPNAYFWAVQHLMFISPTICQTLAGVVVQTRTITLDPSDGPSAVQHELRFSDEIKRENWHQIVLTETGPFFELVGLDQSGYLVELRPDRPPSAEDACIIAIEGIGKGKGKNVGIRSSQKPETVVAVGLWTTLTKEEPLAIVFLQGTFPGFVQLVIDGKPFVTSGGQEVVISSNGPADRMEVDGFSIIEQRANVAIEEMPSAMNGRLSATLRASVANSEITGKGFYRPNARLPIPPAVLEVLRRRYTAVKLA